MYIERFGPLVLATPKTIASDLAQRL